MVNPDKEQIISLVNRLLNRSGLTVNQVVARMQADGCDITRNIFDNHFTTRVDRKPNTSPQWTLALIAAFTKHLTSTERCTAAEAIELARLTGLSINHFRTLRTYFPLVEFITAYKQYVSMPGLTLEEITRLEGLAGQPVDIPCPYRGLQTFEEKHADLFFGREADIEWLLTALQDSRFLAVVGPSGSGKSSVVRAGLIPALRQEDLLIQIIEPGRQPLEALVAALADDIGRSRSKLVQQLAADEQGLLRLALEILDRRSPNTNLLLVVDQFEELFTLCQNETARRSFVANLLRATTPSDSRMMVILTMRADFYSQAATYSNLAVYLADNQVLISPMTETELIRVITQPAQKVGLRFESGLVDRLLQDAAAEPGALPMLEHTLLELWERRQGNELTLAAYQAIGGVQGALAQRADTLLAEFTPEQQTIVRRVMLRLTRLGENTADTRRRATFAELVRTLEEETDVKTVITRLADARLVTTSVDRQTGAEIVDVAHEALIRGWPALQAWLSEDRDALRLHQQLIEATLEWDRHNHDRSYLYRGARLAAAEEWAKKHAGDINPMEHDFLMASLTERDRRATERERQRRRVIRSLMAGLVLTLISLAAAIGLAFFAFDQRQQVELQRQQTLSRQLAAQARDLLDDRLELALLLSVEANHIASTVDACGSLLAALESSPHLNMYLRGHNDWVWSVAFSPDGMMLASGSADGTIILWDTTTRQPLGSPLSGHTDWVRSVAFSPDGHTLASGSADGTIRLWDTVTHQSLSSSLTGHTSFVTGVVFSPDGQILASSSADGTIILWDVSTLPETGISTTDNSEGIAIEPLGAPLTGHTSFVLSLAFSPNSQLLASGGADETLILWDVSARPALRDAKGLTGGEVEQPLAYALTGHQGVVSSVAFSPDGQTLASGGEDKTIILWDVVTRQPRKPPLTGHEGGISSVTFSPDGRMLASGSEDRSVILWDVTTAQALDKPFIGHAKRVLSVAFSPDSANSSTESIPMPVGVLASGSADGTIILWDISTSLNKSTATRQPLAVTLAGHADPVWHVAFNADTPEGTTGQTLLSASSHDAIMLWDMATMPVFNSAPSNIEEKVEGLNTKAAASRPLGFPLLRPDGSVWSVALSPDSRTFAIGNVDGTISLWDVGTRQPIGPPLSGHSDIVLSLAFSPDTLESTGGQILASGSSDSTIRLWDIATHQPIGQPLTGHTKPVFDLAFSPDGKILASSSEDGTILLWDMVTYRSLGPSLTGRGFQNPRLAFSQDGKTLASTRGDNTIVLWDVASRRPSRQPLSGHTDVVLSLAFSPDTLDDTGGQLLASGSEDDTVILWDLATYRPLNPPLVSQDRVRSLAFSPDGQWLAAGGRNDGAIVLWDVNSQSWQRRACQMVTRNLTLTEWERYLEDEPYRATCPDMPPSSPETEGEESLLTSAGTPPSTTVSTPNISGTVSAAIIEKFDSSQGFIQTSDNVYISDGQVHWHIERDGGKQYIYRSIPPFRGNVRLVARGQVDRWTNNCNVLAGIGDEPNSGLAINFGFTGGGCPTNGTQVQAKGIALETIVSTCEDLDDEGWLWIESSTPYTAELIAIDGAAMLSVDGVGSTPGTVGYEGSYTTLWVGNNGPGDWPECTGTIDTLIIEPLD